jgi:hypothetical protein
MKSRKLKWAGHVARVWENRNVYRVSMGKPGIHGKIILKWIFEK